MLDDFAIVTSWRDDWVAVQVTGVVAQDGLAAIGAAVRRAPGRRVQLDLTRADVGEHGFMDTVARWQEAFARTGRVLAVSGE